MQAIKVVTSGIIEGAAYGLMAGAIVLGALVLGGCDDQRIVKPVRKPPPCLGCDIARPN